eukprot:GAHX01000373.1.p1 GENE.GAHX01000373.1~~GAHX01000373.1.p1  ORF type:complete len:684 (+),score=166.21 GAHX01000373.1:35-2053(+)
MKIKTGSYHKASIQWFDPQNSIHPELVQSSDEILKLIQLRHKYQSYKQYSAYKDPVESTILGRFDLTTPAIFKEGVFHLTLLSDATNTLPTHRPILLSEFFHDLKTINDSSITGSLNSFSHTRLQILQKMFHLYKITNWKLEFEDIKANSPDFFQVLKVDNHIHVAASMSGDTLVSYIKRKLEEEPNLVVTKEGQTLSEMFKENKLDVDSLNINQIFGRAPKEMFKRFDVFLEEYNIFGLETFRKLFFKYDNFIKGKFLGEILNIELDKCKDKNIINEYHISVYGLSDKELDVLADFVLDNNLLRENVKWIIQVPRLFDNIKNKDMKFSSFIYNIFSRIIEASLEPKKEGNRKVAKFLTHVVGFDSVDDESRLDVLFDNKLENPDTIVPGSNVPYSHYIYYMWANISSINQIRNQKGLNTFSLRPHSGESGSVHHLATSYLLVDGINHGIMLEKNPVLAYLFYLDQIGCSIALSSNNYLFKNFKKNPFKELFEMGLNVTVSTDDPLQFHITGQPLIEEYALARQYYKLTDCDILEIAKNSVRQSGLDCIVKVRRLGMGYDKPRTYSYPTKITGVSSCRYRFREDQLYDEIRFLCLAASKTKGKETKDFYKKKVVIVNGCKIKGVEYKKGDEFDYIQRTEDEEGMKYEIETREGSRGVYVDPVDAELFIEFCK